MENKTVAVMIWVPIILSVIAIYLSTSKEKANG